MSNDLRRRERVLQQKHSNYVRDANGEITPQMRDELMELLRLFGVPYLVAPSEAEAQCAELELLQLVDGVVTDDSDVWLFGGSNVYKNIFSESKYVELYRARDVASELGLNREDHICLALLLGSDYTVGVHGIGIVNATEIIRVFPGVEGLRKFKKWIDTAEMDELVDGGKTRGSKMKLSKVEVLRLNEMDHFKYEHRRVSSLLFSRLSPLVSHLSSSLFLSHTHFSVNSLLILCRFSLSLSLSLSLSRHADDGDSRKVFHHKLL